MRRSPKGPSSRRMRRAGVAAVAIVATFGAAFALAPIAVRALVQAFELLLRASLWLATSAGRGEDSWTIAATVGGGVTRALVTPGAMATLGALLLLGAAALFGLQRLLGAEEEEESSQ